VQTASQTTSQKSTFTLRANTARTILITGLNLFLQFWYAKQALFWIPKGWVPYYAEWILSFPRAPLGSVSLQVWTMACSGVVKMVSEALIAAAVLGLSYVAAGKRNGGVKEKKAA
jgi:tail-anchored protein insertion receptor